MVWGSLASEKNRGWWRGEKRSLWKAEVKLLRTEYFPDGLDVSFESA